MTKISQLSDIGGNLAANDEFIIRDVSDASTPNKKVTASGFFLVASALGLTGLDRITAGTVASGTQTRVYESGAAGYAETTVSGVNSARTTISGYFENASGTVGGTFFPVVTQTDIGTDPNQVPLNGFLGTMAFQDSAGVNVDLAAIGTATISSATISGGTATLSSAAVTAFSNVPLLTGGGLTFPATQVASADPNTLDDYEEGTWTVQFFDNIIGGGNTSATTGTGVYTKIGRLVTASFQIDNVSTSGLTSGLFGFSLPFNPLNTTETCFGTGALHGVANSTASFYARIDKNFSRGSFYFSSTSFTFPNVNVTDVTSASNRIAATFSYFA
jgi:hypothetical protein